MRGEYNFFFYVRKLFSVYAAQKDYYSLASSNALFKAHIAHASFAE